MNLRAPLFLAAAVLLPVYEAAAHGAVEGAGGFYGGALHPLFVPVQVLAILGTGLLVGQQTSRSPWTATAGYGAGLVAGFAAIVSAVVARWAGEVLLADAVVSGVLVALAQPVPRFLVNVLALTTGLALALDSPPHVNSLEEASMVLIGTFCCAVVLLLIVLEGASMLNGDWQRLGVRIVGSWIAASAIMGLALGLRG
jgi:urease accessory protein